MLSFSHVLLALYSFSSPFHATSSALELDVNASQFSMRQTDSDLAQEIDDLELTLNRAEARATVEGRTILKMGRQMVKDQVVVKGSCWEFINAVYNRAGYPQKKWSVPFKSKKAGPYADVNSFQPGDWLYYINHSFGDIEHSGIFIDWIDFATREALILSYAGQYKLVPGRYKTYDLRHAYNIIRPKTGPAVAGGLKVESLGLEIEN